MKAQDWLKTPLMAAFRAAREGLPKAFGKPSIASPEQFDLGRIRTLPRAGICPAFHLA
jgi:hypothetical protein